MIRKVFEVIVPFEAVLWILQSKHFSVLYCQLWKLEWCITGHSCTHKHWTKSAALRLCFHHFLVHVWMIRWNTRSHCSYITWKLICKDGVKINYKDDIASDVLTSGPFQTINCSAIWETCGTKLHVKSVCIIENCVT